MSKGSLDEKIAKRRNFLVSLLNLEPSEVDRFPPPSPFACNTVGSSIDHTLLKPDATSYDVEKLCLEAMANDFMAVCVSGLWACKAFSLIEKSNVRLCCVVGFPLGASCTRVKVLEAELAIEDGADEIDMVIPIGSLKDSEFETVYRDIENVVRTASKQTSRRGNEVLVKVILETCLLSENEMIDAALLVELAGAHFVKTSTGFSTGGATLEAVTIMKRVVGHRALVKASGGIRTLESVRMYIDAGASRIGTSSGIAIVREAKERIQTGTIHHHEDCSSGGNDNNSY